MEYKYKIKFKKDSIPINRNIQRNKKYKMNKKKK